MQRKNAQIKSITGIRLMLICILSSLAFGMSACGAGSTKQAEPVISAEDIVGHYEIVSMEGDNVPSEEDLAFLQQSGLTITMDIREDGNGVMNLFGEAMNFTYDLEKKIFEIDDQQLPFTTDEETLTLQQDSGNMIFKPVE